MNFLKFFLISALLLTGLTTQTAQKHTTINKQKLVESIKRDLYYLFVEDRTLLAVDFKIQSQGNPILEEDLRNLYPYLNLCEDNAQEKLDEFCRVWKLPRIEISSIR
jgi:hypothetical protein